MIHTDCTRCANSLARFHSSPSLLVPSVLLVLSVWGRKQRGRRQGGRKGGSKGGKRKESQKGGGEGREVPGFWILGWTVDWCMD